MFNRTQLFAVLLGAAFGAGAHYFSREVRSPSRDNTEGREVPISETTGAASRPSVSAIMAARGLECSLLCLRWLETATAADCAAAAPNLTEDPADFEWSEYRRWIFYTRWAELDPKAAMAFCQTQENVALEVILEVWGRMNFSEAWAAAYALPESDRVKACQAVLMGLAVVDPRRAWSEATTHQNLFKNNEDKLKLLVELVKVDPAAAAAAILTTTDDWDDEWKAVRRIFGVWGVRHPKDAWTYATQIQDESLRASACKGVLGRLIEQDVSAAKDFLATFPADSMEAWKGALAERMAYYDAAEAQAWAESLSGPGRRLALAGVGKVLSRSGQPEDALPVFASMNWEINPPAIQTREVFTENGSSYSSSVSIGGDSEREICSSMATALIAWGQRDPAAALKQSSTMLGTTPDSFMFAGGNIVSDWARRDPAAALAAVSALPVDSVGFRDSLLRSAIDLWAKQDFSAAQTAVESLPAGEMRSAATQSVIDNFIHKDPSAAFAWALRQNAETKGELLKYTFSKALAGDPQSALAHLESLQIPSDARRELASIAAERFRDDEPLTAVNVLLKENVTDHALDRSLEIYLQQYPKAASEWVRELPHGEVREASISALAKYLRNQAQPDFEAAFIWAQTMQASEKRDDTLLDTLRSWESKSPGAAKQALGSSKLGPVERSSLLERMSKPPVYQNDPFGF